MVTAQFVMSLLAMALLIMTASNGSVGDGCVIDDENKDVNENNLASEDFISL